MSEKIVAYDIGAFILCVDNKDNYAVTSFQLSKGIGMITSLTADVCDMTQAINYNASSYPQQLGSIKTLFDNSQKNQGVGKLSDVKLIQYRKSGQRVWFLGKVCEVTPTLRAAQGVNAGMQCYCMGKACQLLYQPFTDFIYVPHQFASDIAYLQSMGVFKKGGINQALYAASQRPSIPDIIQHSEFSIKTEDNILEMLDKALKSLHAWQKTNFKKEKIEQLGEAPDLKENGYFKCNLKLADTLANAVVGGIHPYVQGLIGDLINGFWSTTILDAITSSIEGNGRYLTFSPSSIASGEDFLNIIPAYIQPVNKEFKLTPENMLACTVSSNALDHIRTPNLIYTRSKLRIAYQKAEDRNTFSQAFGKYALTTGAKPPYRLKVLDVPDWLLNTLQESDTQGQNKTQNKKTELKNQPLNKVKENKKQSQRRNIDFKKYLQTLNAFAKTIFFHTYMLDRNAEISLAVNDNTLNLDKYIGQSLEFQMPVQAAQLGKSGYDFYGRLQGVRYAFQAATTPTAKSVISLSCTLSGVTAKDAPGKDLFAGKDNDKGFIYKRS